MRLTINTEMGGFDFTMPQTNVIELLNVAKGLSEYQEEKIETAIPEKKVMELPKESIQEAIRKAKTNMEEIYSNEASEKSKYPTDGKYKGFLLIRCDDCGQVKRFCAKQPINRYRCDDCGGVTKLTDLRTAYMDCKCGRHYKYRTNEKSEVITNNCMDCGAPVDMMLNSKRTAYTTIK